MAKVVTCPSCQAKGSVPDDAKAARIRCPKCGQMFDIKGASGGATSTSMKKPGSSAGARPSAAPRPAAYEDLEGAEPLPPVANTSSRRMAAGPPRGQAQGQGSGQSPMLFVVIGVGSVAVLLIIGLLIAVLMRGNGNGGNVAAAPAGGGQGPAEVAERLLRRSQPAPAASPANAISAAAPASTASSLEMDHDQIVRRLKDATVYIKNKIAGKNDRIRNRFRNRKSGS